MIRATSANRTTKSIDYPTSDGRPVAETETHIDDLINARAVLREHYRDRQDVCVSGNLLIFYEKDNRRKHVSPDVFVVFGVPKRVRDYYLLWEEAKGPDVIIELTSKTTKKEDLVKKKNLYRDVLKTEEYFLFDPTEDYLKPSMQGFRLVNGEYVPIQPDGNRLPSERLDMWLERDGVDLRLRDRKTNELLLTSIEQRDLERQLKEQEKQRAEQEKERAEQEKQRAEQERRLKEQEKQRADSLASEVERLRQMLESRQEQDKA